jgi:hypothetical protein
LLQVIKVQRRPLALAQRMIVASTSSPTPAFQRGTRAAHRAGYEAAWLDLSHDVYFVPIMVRPDESQFIATQHDTPVGPVGPKAVPAERPVSGGSTWKLLEEEVQ